MRNDLPHLMRQVLDMESAMRITKAWLRGTRVRLDQRVKDIFKLKDDDLVKLLKTMWPNLVPGTREENLRMAVLLSVQEMIPDSMTF